MSTKRKRIHEERLFCALIARNQAKDAREAFLGGRPLADLTREERNEYWGIRESDEDAARIALDELAERREDLRYALEANAEEIRKEIPVAIEDGLSRVEVADHLRLERSSMYRTYVKGSRET